MTAPSSTVTFLAEHHIGLDHYVAAEFGIGGKKNRLRRDERDAGFERGLPQPALRRRFGFGELSLVVDAAHLVLLDFDRDRAQLHAARDFDRIGQIEFGFTIAVADLLDNRKRAIAGECHQPAVAQRDAALGGAGVGVFANSDKFAILDDQAPVTRRIGRAEAEHGKRCAFGERGAQALERLRPDERGVAVEDQNLIRPLGDGGFRREHSLRRAAPLGLHENGGIRAYPVCLRGHGVLARSNDNGGRGNAGFGGSIQHMSKQRFAGERMQHLRPRRTHARALAGRKHDRKAGPSQRSAFHLISSQPPRLNVLADASKGRKPANPAGKREAPLPATPRRRGP